MTEWWTIKKWKMDRCKCYLCEKLCYCESQTYNECTYRKQKSFGVPENRAYEEACTRLAVKFARKHGRRFEGWVGHFDPKKHTWCEGAGGHAMIGDEVYSMEDMRTDLMMDAHPDAITAFYEECVQEHYAARKENREERHVNYRSWLLGARHDMERSSEEWKRMQAQELEGSRKRAEEAKRLLMEEMQRNADELLAESDGLY